MELSKRYCKVILEKLDENGNIEDYREIENFLDVKFNYTRFLGNGMHSKGKISVCGLSRKAIDIYTSFYSQDVEVLKRKTITVQAGYSNEDKNKETIGTILSGTIVNALPSLPPDVWLNCEVINQYEAKLEKKNYGFKGTKTLDEIVSWAAKITGLKVDNRLSKNDEYRKTKYSNFNFEGNKFDLVGRIGAIFYDALAKKGSKAQRHNGITTYIEDDTLIVDYQDLLQEEYDRNGTPLVASKDSEQLKLVGLPQPMWAGQAVSITTLLNPSIRTGQVIELKSDLIKALSGYYYVFNITYTGEYKGTNWYSQFLCRRLK